MALRREPGAGERTLVIRTAREGAAGGRVEVQDSGVGVDDTDLERMLQPRYTTQTEGLGMGLTIARTIVDAHGGRLGAAHNVHGGATFHFTVLAGAEDTS